MKLNVLLLVMLLLSQAQLMAQWETKASFNQARSQHCAVMHPNGNIYVICGWAGSSELDSVEIYNTATDTWTTGANAPAQARGGCAAVGQDGLIYVFLPDLGSGPNASYTYNPSTNSWTAIATLPASVWEGAAVCAPDGRIFVFGGELSYKGYNCGTAPRPRPASRCDLVQIYDPSSNTWSNGTPIPVATLQLAAVSARDGNIYLFGGTDDASSNPLNNVQIYHPATDTWSAGTPMPATRNQFGAALAPDGKIYLVGGKQSYYNSDPPFFATVYIYDPAFDSWSDGPSLPMELGETKAVSSYAGIYQIGGCNSLFQNVNFFLPIASAHRTSNGQGHGGCGATGMEVILLLLALAGVRRYRQARACRR